MLIFLFLLFLGELFCRIKIFIQLKDTYYLTSPFNFRKENKEIPKPKEESDDNFIHFNDNEYRESMDWKYWHRGFNWYYKAKPGTYSAPKPYAYGSYTINSLGFRGGEFNPYDKQNKIRVFCVGDSTTFGKESPDNETWPARFEYHLNIKKPNKYEVINSGFGSYYSLNYLNLIRYELIKYKPDLIIVCGGINDLNIYRTRQEKKVSKIIRKIHEVLYFRYSMLYTLLIEKISVLCKGSPMPMNIYDNESKEFFMDNTEKIIKFCKENNIAILFVRQMAHAASGLFLDNNFTLGEYEKISKQNQKDKNGVEYIDYLSAFRLKEIMESLKYLCQKYNVKMFDFRREFYESIVNNNKIFFDYVHLTPAANDLLAKLVAGKILSMRLGTPFALDK